MKRFPLMVIDDLGIERQNNYAFEIVHEFVDERYKSGKPLIVSCYTKVVRARDKIAVKKEEKKQMKQNYPMESKEKIVRCEREQDARTQVSQRGIKN